MSNVLRGNTCILKNLSPWSSATRKKSAKIDQALGPGSSPLKRRCYLSPLKLFSRLGRYLAVFLPSLFREKPIALTLLSGQFRAHGGIFLTPSHTLLISCHRECFSPQPWPAPKIDWVFMG